MNQNLWGPHGWFILHSMTLSYPMKPSQKDKDDHKGFLESFGKVIFCDICKIHYNRNLQENPPRLDSRKDFFEWMVDLHNEINGRTGKRPYTYEEVKKLYQEHYQKEFAITKNNDKISIRDFFHKMYCFWLQYHTYLIILTLIGVIGYLRQDTLKKYLKKII